MFRTYLASKTVAEYLRQHDGIRQLPPYRKLHLAKLANLEAAMMCNHKRTIPASFEKSLQKKRDTLDSLRKMRPWSKTKATLDKVAASEPKTDKQKASREKRIKNLNKLVRSKKKRHKERVEKIKLQIELAERTRDYNLGTSLRNYIDPRIFKAWTSRCGNGMDQAVHCRTAKKIFVGAKRARSLEERICKVLISDFLRLAAATEADAGCTVTADSADSASFCGCGWFCMMRRDAPIGCSFECGLARLPACGNPSGRA